MLIAVRIASSGHARLVPLTFHKTSVVPATTALSCLRVLHSIELRPANLPNCVPSVVKNCFGLHSSSGSVASQVRRIIGCETQCKRRPSSHAPTSERPASIRREVPIRGRPSYPAPPSCRRSPAAPYGLACSLFQPAFRIRVSGSESPSKIVEPNLLTDAPASVPTRTAEPR